MQVAALLLDTLDLNPGRSGTFAMAFWLPSDCAEDPCGRAKPAEAEHRADEVTAAML